MSSTYGEKIKISIFGQSHSTGIGGVIDGVPAGIKIDMDKMHDFMARRSPRGNFSTARRESDEVEFIGGIVGNVTCGAPICVMIKNNDTKSVDYAEIAKKPRPGHADYPAHIKFGGYQDVRGGGHFSGRLTAPICAIGFICMSWLKTIGIETVAHIKSIADINDSDINFVNPDMSALKKCTSMDFPVIDENIGKSMLEKIALAKSQLDSVGGTIECVTIGIPVGVGDGIFGGLENKISTAIFGVGGVKGIEFGTGFDCSKMRGSAHNDSYYMDKDGIVRTLTNNSGGIIGGMSNGMPLIFRVAVKPTSSIAQEQKTINFDTYKDDVLEIRGRHDPCIVPRAVPVIEALTAIAIADTL